MFCRECNPHHCADAEGKDVDRVAWRQVGCDSNGGDVESRASLAVHVN